MTRRPDDQILMAYADGALGTEELTVVEAAVRFDVEARRHVAMFLSTAALSRLAFHEPMWADIPPRLLRVLHTTETGGNVVSFLPWQLLADRLRRMGPTILACSCLAAGVGNAQGVVTSDVTDLVAAYQVEDFGWRDAHVPTFVDASQGARDAFSRKFPSVGVAQRVSKLTSEPESRKQ